MNSNPPKDFEDLTPMPRHLREFAARIRCAQEFLGVPGRPFLLSGLLERTLLAAAVLEHRRGLAGEHAYMVLRGTRRGHHVLAALERYRLNIGGRDLPLVKVIDNLLGPRMNDAATSFWVVPEGDFLRLYRFLLTQVRRAPAPRAPAPIMHQDVEQLLWNNSIGFLRSDGQLFKRYNIPQKRGILLTGRPGNGKTMACRWLRSHCETLALEFSHVSAERYERARRMGDSEDLFTLSQPGIIVFDDFDLAVRDREQFGATSHHSTFLGELDGLRVREGVVFVFTTNAALSDLDPAFLRPGRIDVVAHFPCPDAELRRRFVLERWQADVRDALDVEQVVADTTGLSFAEMEGLRTHLVLRFLVSQHWDWSEALRAFHEDQRRSKQQRRVGFMDGRTAAVDLPLETIRNSD